MAYPAALLWECTKKNSSFIRKGGAGAPVMSADPNNLAGINSFKFSGLVGGDTLGLCPKKVGPKESIVLVTKHSKRSRALRPQSMFIETGIPKQAKKGVAAIEKSVAAKFYRRDLLELAKAKYMKVKASFGKKKVTFKSRRNKKA